MDGGSRCHDQRPSTVSPTLLGARAFIMDDNPCDLDDMDDLPVLSEESEAEGEKEEKEELPVADAAPQAWQPDAAYQLEKDPG